MIHWLFNIAGYLVCAIASAACARWVNSTFSADVLVPNLTTAVLALLAINVQTTAVIAVKLRELADRSGASFKASVGQFRVAIYEQAGLVLISFVLGALFKSPMGIPLPLWMEIAAFGVMFASLHIFLDTSVGLLISMFPEDGS